MVFQMRQSSARLRKGVSEVAPTLIVFTVTLTVLTMLTVFNLCTSVELFTTVLRSSVRRATEILIKGAVLEDCNTLLRLNLTNKGPMTLTNLNEVEVVITYLANVSGDEVLITQVFTHDTWNLTRIFIGDAESNAHMYLRPGETAEISLHLLFQPLSKAEISLVIISNGANKAEYVLVAP